ncbi:MAG: TetR/AcrR family transcriptional regulator [Pseudomonadota bacterium]
MPFPASAKTPDEQQPRRGRRKEARPGELIEAALDLFVEKGFAATRVEEIAARAGVSKGTLFLYYGSKEELFKAVVRHSIVGCFAEWNEQFEAWQGGSAELVRMCLDAWWDRIGTTRGSGITKLMFSEAQNFPDVVAFYEREVIAPCHSLLRRVLERGVARGEFAIADIDYAIYTLVAPMIFLVLHKHSLGCGAGRMPIDPQRYIAAQADTLLRGLCVRPGESTR